MVGLDCAIIMHPQVWKVSGHYDLFHDFMQTCRQCKKLVRADHVGEMLKESEWVASFGTPFNLVATDKFLTVDGAALLKWAKTKGRKVAPGLALVRNPEVTLSWLAERVANNPGQPLAIG